MKAERKGLVSRVRFFATPWTVARQAPLSMGFSSQDYWDGFPFPSPGNLPDSGIKPRSPALQADSLPLSHLASPYKYIYTNTYLRIRIFVYLCIYIYIFTNAYLCI